MYGTTRARHQVQDLERLQRPGFCFWSRFHSFYEAVVIRATFAFSVGEMAMQFRFESFRWGTSPVPQSGLLWSLFGMICHNTSRQSRPDDCSLATTVAMAFHLVHGFRAWIVEKMLALFQSKMCPVSSWNFEWSTRKLSSLIQPGSSILFDCISGNQAGRIPGTEAYSRKGPTKLYWLGRISLVESDSAFKRRALLIHPSARAV